MKYDLNDPNVVIELLDKAVEKRGADYRYQEEFGMFCHYVVNGKPGCIVGQVLFDAEVDFDHTADISGLYGDGLAANDAMIEALAPNVGINNQMSITILSVAQGMQDSGKTWGESVNRVRSLVVD